MKYPSSMDSICQSSGVCPNSTSSVVEGFPSPSLSYCSEPILPLPPSRSESRFFSALQLMSPRIQVLNGTMEIAEQVRGKKLPMMKSAHRKKSKIIAAFPVIPDSGGEFVTGGRKNIGGHSVPKLKTTPFHYPFQYLHLKSWGQIARHNQSSAQKESKQYGLSGFPAKGHRESDHTKRSGQSMTMMKHLPSESDLPSLTLVKPKVFDGDTAILRKPGKLWRKKTRVKQKVLGKLNRKRTQRKSNLLHKTELCVHWTLTSICQFDNKCKFAHGIDELKDRVRPSNYKTKPCTDCPLKNHGCSYGPRCNFCHPGEAIRRDVGSAYFDREYYKDLESDFKDNKYPFGIFV